MARELEEAKAGAPPLVVEIAVRDFCLRGCLWKGDRNWIALIHQTGGDLDDWGDLPRLLNDAGYTVLAVDLPGHGLSDDPRIPAWATRISEEIARYCLDNGANAFFAIAAGDLCSPAVLSTHVRAMIAASPTGAIGVRPVKTPPVLILAGGGDPEAALAANEFFRRMRGWAVLSSFGTTDQGAAIFGGPWSRHALEQTLAFLRDYRRDESVPWSRRP